MINPISQIKATEESGKGYIEMKGDVDSLLKLGVEIVNNLTKALGVAYNHSQEQTFSAFVNTCRMYIESEACQKNYD